MITRFLHFLTAFIFFFFFCSITTHQANTYFVSNSGHDSNTGLSLMESFASLQQAADIVQPGDSVLVANGTYTGFNLETSGNAAQPIVFMAFGASVLINSPNLVTDDGINVEGANWIEINGFIVNDQPRNGIRIVLADHCIIRNNHCDNNFERGIFTGFTNDILIEWNTCTNSIDEHGIYFSNSGDNPIIRYNNCHHNNAAGIHVNADLSSGGDGIITGAQIYGNIIHDNGMAGGAAINMDGAQDAFVYNNVIYNNHATGIAVFQIDGAEPSLNAIIAHNTIVHPNDARWCILVVNGSTGAQVYNNIIINQHAWRGSIAVDAASLSGFASDYNLLSNSLSADGDGTFITFSEWQALGFDQFSQLADNPGDLFENPDNDFHLHSSSQAIDAGNGDYSFGITDDLDGNQRPSGANYDLGAYESDALLNIDEVIDNQKDRLSSNAGKVTFDGRTLYYSFPFYQAKIDFFTIEGRLLRSHLIPDQNGTIRLDFIYPGIFIYVISKNGVLVDQKICLIQ